MPNDIFSKVIERLGYEPSSWEYTEADEVYDLLVKTAPTVSQSIPLATTFIRRSVEGRGIDMYVLKIICDIEMRSKLAELASSFNESVRLDIDEILSKRR